MVIYSNEFYSRISAARLHAAEIYLKMSQALTQQHQLIIECFEELYAALKNLELANEALNQQNQELATARELIEVERQRYQDLFELVPNAYLVTDRKGIILEANPAAATLFNVLQRFLVGKPLASFVSKEERRVFLVELSKLELSKQRHEREVRLCPPNGNPIDATLTVTNVHDLEGRLLTLGWLVGGITKSKAAEPEDYSQKMCNRQPHQ